MLIEGETRNYLGLEQNRGQGERAQHVVVAHLAVCKEYQFIHMSGSGPEAGVSSAGGKGLTTVPCFPMHQILSMASVPYTDFYSIVSIECHCGFCSKLLPPLIVLSSVYSIDDATMKQI